MKPVAIIGGGITGLTAAYNLQKLGVPVALYEGSARVGGVIQSIRRNGFLAESGPNTIIETSPKITALIRDLNLDGRKLYSNPKAHKRFLVRDGRLVRMPESIPGFVATPLFSPSAKCRLLAEPFRKPAPEDSEETVEHFVLRRLGRDFLDYAINPLVGGVYAGDPARLSVKEAFPKLHALEQKYHSLLLGQFLGRRERKRRAEVSKAVAPKFSFDEGLQVLTETLREKLGEAVRLKARVNSVGQTRDGWFVLSDSHETSDAREFGAVLYAGTAHKLAQLQIDALHAPSLESLAQVHYPPVASLVFGFRREDVMHPLDGFGVLIPEVEKFNILGAIFSSSLFPNRAPKGYVTITCYLGGARNPYLASLGEKTQFELARRDMEKLLGVTGEPVFQHQSYFPAAIPQYEVGYGRYKKLMATMESQCPGFFMAGHYRDGISLGDSIVSGNDVATRIAAYLSNESKTKPSSANHPLAKAA